MPIYTYKCPKCGYTADHRHEMTADFETVCPKDATTMTKQLGLSGVAFKGSGFYVTDKKK